MTKLTINPFKLLLQEVATLKLKKLIPKNKAQRITSAIMLTLTIMYYYFHPLFLLTLPTILTIACTIWLLFKNPSFIFKFKSTHFIFILLLMVIMTSNIYGYYSYTYRFEKLFDIVDFNKSLILNLGKYLATLTAYLLTATAIGDLILRSYKTEFKRLRETLGYYYLSFGIGILITGTILFIAGVYGYISPNILTTILILPILINFKMYKVAFFYLKSLIIHTYSKKIELFRLVLYTILMLFAASIISTLLRSFVDGADGLRIYLTLPKDIANTGQLPTTKGNTLFPFFTSIIFTPAFMIGGIPIITSVMYTISSLYIIGFYLLIKKQVQQEYILPVLLTVTLFPPILRMYLGEYKVDVFLTLISTFVFYTTYLFINTKVYKFAYLSTLFMGLALIIKLTAIYYIIPTTLYFAISTIKTQGQNTRTKINHLVIISLLLILPLVPWITMYKVHIKPFGDIGLNTRALNLNINRKPKNNPSAYEEIKYFESSKTVKEYFKLPLRYFTDNTSNYRGYFFSLRSIGILTILGIALTLIKVSKRSKNPAHNAHSMLFKISLSSLAIFIATTPTFTWYATPTWLLITVLSYTSIYNPAHNYKYKLLITNFILTLSVIIIIPFCFISSFMYYFPHNATIEDIYTRVLKKSSNHYHTYADALEIARVINNSHPHKKIMVASRASFANINYFIDDFYNKVIYLDKQDVSTVNNEIVNRFIRVYGIKYLILNEIIKDAESEDLKIYYNQVKTAFNNNGTALVKGGTFTLYKTYDGY